jgi:hypothetical protein
VFGENRESVVVRCCIYKRWHVLRVDLKTSSGTTTGVQVRNYYTGIEHQHG